MYERKVARVVNKIFRYKISLAFPRHMKTSNTGIFSKRWNERIMPELKRKNETALVAVSKKARNELVAKDPKTGALMESVSFYNYSS